MTMRKFCARCDEITDHQAHTHAEAMADRRARQVAALIRQVDGEPNVCGPIDCPPVVTVELSP